MQTVADLQLLYVLKYTITAVKGSKMNLQEWDYHTGSSFYNINYNIYCVCMATYNNTFLLSSISVYSFIAHLHSMHTLLFIVYINCKSIMEQLESCLWILLLTTYGQCRRIFGPPVNFYPMIYNWTPWMNGPLVKDIYSWATCKR